MAAADRLVANTTEEARQLVELYGASPWRVETVSPGVDLSVFRAGPALEARRRLGALGVKFLFEPGEALGGGKVVSFRDPEGNELQIVDRSEKSE